jgi:membrane protein YqaA with SNARE-associated domain
VLSPVVTETAVLLAVAFVGTVIWPLNPDAALAYYVGSRGHSPVLGVLVALVGQIALLWPLFHLGHHVRVRWAWLDRQCHKVEARWGAKLLTEGLVVAATSGAFGIPPSVPTVLLAAALGLPARRILPVLFFARLLWFSALALVARLAHR